MNTFALLNSGLKNIFIMCFIIVRLWGLWLRKTCCLAGGQSSGGTGWAQHLEDYVQLRVGPSTWNAFNLKNAIGNYKGSSQQRISSILSLEGHECQVVITKMRSAISGPSYLTAHFAISGMNWMKETVQSCSGMTYSPF